MCPSKPWGDAWRELARPVRRGGIKAFALAAGTDTTLSVNNTPETVLVTAPASGTCNVILSAGNANAGDKFKVSNTGAQTGTPQIRNLAVSDPSPYSLTAGKWVDYVFDGSGWVRVAGGTIPT